MEQQIELLAFDADDTLWVTMPLYLEAVEKVKDILETYIEPGTIFEKNMFDIESRNGPVRGYGTKSFIISMVEMAVAASSQTVSAGEIQKIISIGKDLMDRPLEVLDGVEDVIRELSAHWNLMLLTKGDLFEQQGKIYRSGLSEYFRYVEILNDKSDGSYSNLLEKYGVLPAQFLMVGNSLESDIIPVVNIGGNAVHIPDRDARYHETVSVGNRVNGWTRVDNIRSLPGVIRGLF